MPVPAPCFPMRLALSPGDRRHRLRGDSLVRRVCDRVMRSGFHLR